MSEISELSEREQEILKLVATGASNKEIARKLNISTNTVKVHLRNIFAKIGAASRTEAAMYAVNSGFIQTPQFVDSTNDSELVGSDTKLNWLARYHIAPLWFGLFLLLLAILLGIIIVLIDRPQNQFS